MVRSSDVSFPFKPFKLMKQESSLRLSKALQDDSLRRFICTNSLSTRRKSVGSIIDPSLLFIDRSS